MEAASPFQSVALVDVVAARARRSKRVHPSVEATCVLVSSIALAIARDPDVSRDIAQDVFLAAWHDISKLREPSSFLPWLRQITRNRAHHVLRTSRRRRRRIEEQETSDLLDAVVDPRPDASQQLIAEERRRAVADDHRPAARGNARGGDALLPRGPVRGAGGVSAGHERGCGPPAAVAGAPSAPRRAAQPPWPRSHHHLARERVHRRRGGGPFCGSAGRGFCMHDWSCRRGQGHWPIWENCRCVRAAPRLALRVACSALSLACAISSARRTTTKSGEH